MVERRGLTRYGTRRGTKFETKIMLANTAGTLPIIIRAGIGKGLLVRPMIIVVQSVPRFCVTIRGDISTAIGIWKTTRGLVIKLNNLIMFHTVLKMKTCYSILSELLLLFRKHSFRKPNCQLLLLFS